MAKNVHAIRLLRVKAHAILEDDGVTLIDTGYAGSLPRIEKALADLHAVENMIERLPAHARIRIAERAVFVNLVLEDVRIDGAGAQSVPGGERLHFVHVARSIREIP